MKTLEQKKKSRFLFLEKLYNNSNGGTRTISDMWKVGEGLWLDKEEIKQIVEYLSSESLIESITLGGGIGLTHWGVKEVEEALENPDKATEHFLPINIINIGTMTNSTLQQATSNSTINFHFDSNKAKELENLLLSIDKIMNVLNLSTDLHKELISEIQTLKVQKESPRPKDTIITESLKSIRTILESVTSNAMTPIIVEQITRLLT